MTLAIEIIVNKKDGIVRLIDKYETTDSVQEVLEADRPKAQKAFRAGPSCQSDGLRRQTHRRFGH